MNDSIDWAQKIKTITVEKPNWLELSKIKLKRGFKNMNSVVGLLIKIYKEHNGSGKE